MAGHKSGAEARSLDLYSSLGSPIPDRYQTLVERSEAAVAFVSAGATPYFVAVSNGFLETLEVERSRVAGRLLADVLSREDWGALILAINRCLATSRTVRTTIGVPDDASGRFVEIAVHAARVPGFGSHVVLAAEGGDPGREPMEASFTPLLESYRDPSDRAGGERPDKMSRGGDLTGAALLRAEEQERARIGRELHDSTSQYLVAADLGVLRVLRSVGVADEEREGLLGVQASLAAAQQEMRAFAYLLHPPELREHGLVGSIERFCTGFARRSGLQIAVTTEKGAINVSSDVAHALFRVCQEALMNVHRHAFARHASVTLEVRKGHLILEVRDDGVGVDGVDRFEHGGIGVAGMKSRLISIGGELSLDHLDPGLSVRAQLPLPRRQRANAKVVRLRS